MELPIPDPVILLTHWMEWERAEVSPGKVLSDLKRAGMKDLLQALADAKLEAADGE